MDELNQSIAKHIKKGDYYTDALSWYNLRFIAPVTERSILIFITALSVISGSIATFTSYNMFPIVTPYPVAIKVHDSMNNISFISSIEEPLLSTQQTIAKYLLQQYVITRENYNYSRFPFQFLRMENASSKKVYREFRREFDPKDPNSRLIQYAKHSTRETEILKLEFDKATQGRHTEKAYVLFTTRSIRKKDGKIVKNAEQWVAHISYVLEPIVVRNETRPLDFKVTSYNVVRK